MACFTNLASGYRFSLESRLPKRPSSVPKCFFVAVVTVLMTAPSNREGDDEDKLDEIK